MFKPFEEDENVAFGDFDFNLPQSLVEELEQGWAGKFKTHIFDNIDEYKFADMYSEDNGRPNFPVKIIVSLEILKHLFDISDKELLESFHCDIRFMKAVGLKRAGQLTLGLRTIYDFRENLVDYMNETGENPLDEIFDELLAEFIAAADLDTDIQRMDSTMVKANIKHLSRIQLMRKVFENFVRELSDSQKNRIHKNILQILDDNFSEYLSNHDKEDILNNLLGKLNSVKDLFKNDESINDTKVYHHLVRVVEEQSIETASQLKAKDDADIESSSLQNPNDEDATFRKKGMKSHQGYSCNISETASPDNSVQMIIDVSVEPNINSDVNFLNDRLEEINIKAPVNKLVVDGAYYGSDTVNSASKTDTEIIPTELTGSNPKYSTAGFTLSKKQGVISCPMGKVPDKDKYLENSDTYAAWFEKEDCEECEFRSECPVNEQKKSMTVRFTQTRHDRDKLRAKLAGEEYQEIKNSRAAVEGTFSALKRSQGLDKFKVTGLVKAKCSSLYKMIGYNLKQLVRALKMESKQEVCT
ncbi:transposase-like protein DUF772 [Halanaerobium saccharolyticum]|uniref:Transposase-like protein DUF772 n=1 Tax=Halanaerobium saccharolyticum TaxID=43595 RepID=A0A4R6LQF0_9FIRM|nr:transposase [Halanaerobium saccharolyticum]TDO89394.1 transposase-like protein DUF772 [Halanaerobium saccharolyticum]